MEKIDHQALSLSQVVSFHHSASFRDPRAFILEDDQRILRALNEQAAQEYHALESSGLLQKLIKAQQIIQTCALTDVERTGLPAAALYLEHKRLPFISYPYEWPFLALKKAALLHLELHMQVLEQDVTLLDASAYNIQFEGVKPIFIDIPSLRAYKMGEFWLAHQQFLDHFLNPLLLDSEAGIAFHAAYRGNLEGISSQIIYDTLPFTVYLKPKLLMNVALPTLLQRKFGNHAKSLAPKMQQQRLSKTAFMAMLQALHRLVQGLKPKHLTGTWDDYEFSHSYNAAEFEQKSQVISSFCETIKPKLLLDLGCNSGVFSEVALASGAEYVVGLEQEALTANRAFERAERKQLNFLPLVMDLANPSPAQGWAGKERQSFAARAPYDGLIALALVHHLAIGKNIPLPHFMDYLLKLAPCGVVEFIPKSDPQVKRLLALRDDIFTDYTIEHFEQLLRSHAQIIKQSVPTETGRVLYWYQTRVAS